MTESAAKIAYYSPDFQLVTEKTVVLTGGCFDVLHYGHLQFLKEAKKRGDMLVVALESDEFIEKQKIRTPVHTQKQRAELLSELGPVDYVVMLPYLHTDGDYFNLVKKLRPSVIAITEGDEQTENKKKQAHAVGGRVEIVTNVVKDFSTTNIIKRK